MTIRKTLFLLTLNYILIFAWMFLYRLEEMSALLIFPITMGIAFLDTVFSEGRKSAYLWCGNLLIATIAGILLQAYICIRATGDLDHAVLRAAIEIPAAVLIIGMIAVISGHEAAKLKKKRIEKRMSIASYSGVSGGIAQGYGNDDNEKSVSGWGDRGGRFGQPQGSDTDDDDELLFDDDDDDEEDNEPTFRVIKKS